MTREIYLTQNQVTLVDDWNYDFLTDVGDLSLDFLHQPS